MRLACPWRRNPPGQGLALVLERLAVRRKRDLEERTGRPTAARHDDGVVLVGDPAGEGLEQMPVGHGQHGIAPDLDRLEAGIDVEVDPMLRGRP
jgi:hypothetical protein